VDFVRRWSEKAEIGVGRFIPWLGVTASKFYDWRQRYGCVNEHNGWVPRDFWLELWEKEAIIEFHLKNPLEGYRRLMFMMLDADVVAVSPASVWRVLKQAGLLSRWKSKPSRKGTGFEQPLQPHQHWHIDVSYINLCGTFYYLCSILDGFSRFLVHWDLRDVTGRILFLSPFERIFRQFSQISLGLRTWQLVPAERERDRIHACIDR
jgi:putative transposase